MPEETTLEMTAQGVTKGSGLKALADYLRPFSVVERVELLPYHTMGIYKYRSLGIPYPLEGVEAMSAEEAARSRSFLKGLLNVEVG